MSRYVRRPGMPTGSKEGGLVTPTISLLILEKPLKQMKAAAIIADRLEIGGFGFIERRMMNGKPTHVLFDIMIPTQTVGPGGQDFSPMDATDYRVEKGYEPESMRFSWHTHGYGTPFWSETDENWILDMGELGMPWVYSLVTESTFTDVELRFDMFDPFRFVTDRVTYTELVDDKVFELMEEVIEQRVTVAKPVAQMTKELEEKGWRDIKVEWENNKEPTITGVMGVDTDRDDLTEEEAARIMYDLGDEETDELGSEPEVTIIEELPDLITDDEDILQDEIVKELEEKEKQRGQ